jgi:hypothetical protein
MRLAFSVDHLVEDLPARDRDGHTLSSGLQGPSSFAERLGGLWSFALEGDDIEKGPADDAEEIALLPSIQK